METPLSTAYIDQIAEYLIKDKIPYGESIPATDYDIGSYDGQELILHMVKNR